MPPRGGQFKYRPAKIRREVPRDAGVYWLWSFGELVRIGQSTNLRRRLLEYRDRDPNYFRYQCIDEYFSRRGIRKPPHASQDALLDRIENTELHTYKETHGELPRWNRHMKHYEKDLIESLIDKLNL